MRIFYDYLEQSRTILTSSCALVRQNCVRIRSQMQMTTNLKTGKNCDEVLKHKQFIWFLFYSVPCPLLKHFYQNVCLDWDWCFLQTPHLNVTGVPKVYPSYAAVCVQQRSSFYCIQALRKVSSVAWHNPDTWHHMLTVPRSVKTCLHTVVWGEGYNIFTHMSSVFRIIHV